VTTTPLLPGLVLGFPPIRGREWGGGTTDALQEGKATPAGVTASVSGLPTRFLPSPNPHTRTIRRAPPDLPPTSTRHRDLEAILAVSLWSPEKGLDVEMRNSRVGGSSTSAEREGTTSTAFAVADRTWQRGQTRPAGPKQARKDLATTLQQAGRSTAATQPPPSHLLHLQGASPGRHAQPARPAPLGPELGPDLGRAGPAMAAARAAPPPTDAPPLLHPPDAQVPPRRAGPEPPKCTAARQDPHAPSAATGRDDPAAAGTAQARPGGKLLPPCYQTVN
jgi:hypothetical protein